MEFVILMAMSLENFEENHAPSKTPNESMEKQIALVKLVFWAQDSGIESRTMLQNRKQCEQPVTMSPKATVRQVE